MRWRSLTNSYTDRLAEAKAKPPHELLDVSMTATQTLARDSYLKLVKTYHPDRADPFMFEFNQEMLKIINAAFAKLPKE